MLNMSMSVIMITSETMRSEMLVRIDSDWEAKIALNKI